MHSACDVEPLFARFGREVAERADGFLARAFGGGDRLHQQIAGVGLIFLLSGALTEIHCATMVAFCMRDHNIFHVPRLVTILASFDGVFTCPVDESSTYTRVATRSRPKSAKMEGATVEVGLALCRNRPDISGSTKFRGVKRRDRHPAEARAGVRGRRLGVRPSISAALTPRKFVLPRIAVFSARCIVLRGLRLAPYRAFLHESCSYPEQETRMFASRTLDDCKPLQIPLPSCRPGARPAPPASPSFATSAVPARATARASRP